MRNSISPPALLLTAKQAAEALAISPRKLWSLTASREIRATKFGRSVRYSIESLRDWIAANEEGGDAQ